MKAIAVDTHVGEGPFPEFARGTPVTLIAPNEKYPHWWSCTIEGHNTYVPDYYVVQDKLDRGYNPTELQAEPTDELEVFAISYSWLVARNNRTGKVGWIPADKVASPL
ncbi:hypothetical protein JCM19000A_19150 [Silvimonas sp. JCM 19000]